jgi:hypothetical protein
MTTPYSSRKSIALGDILNVSIDNSILNSDQFLKYNNTNDLWENSILGLDISTVNVYEAVNNTDYNLVLTDGNGNGKTLLVDSTTTPSTINPSSGDITIVNTLKINQNSIAIGKNSGNTNQSTYAISLGDEAGYLNQSFGAIAIGSKAGKNNQSLSSIAIGLGSGQDNQGNNCIAIGSLSGILNQVNNSIILNATGFDLSSGSTGLFVKPIRAETDVSTFESLYYDIGTGEIASGATPSGGGGSSTTIDITESNTNADYNLVFTNGTGTGKTLLVDATTTPITINPNTGDMSIVDTLKLTQNSVSLCKGAGSTNQSSRSVAIGFNSGNNNQGTQAVSVGDNCANTNQSAYAVAIGTYAGNNGQSADGIAIGRSTGEINQGINAIALGQASGYTTQGNRAIAIGYFAGENNQGVGVGYCIAIGNQSGQYSQGIECIALGNDSGNSNQGQSAIALGAGAGRTSQGTHSIALGWLSGNGNQQQASVAIGKQSGELSQNQEAVAIGSYSGKLTQQEYSVGIGSYAGYSSQKTKSVCIGYKAGQTTAGTSSLLLGALAGQSSSVDNSIILNAMGVDLTSTRAGLYIDPIRAENDVSSFKGLYYDTVSKEITSSSNPTFSTINVSGTTTVQNVISSGSITANAINGTGLTISPNMTNVQSLTINQNATVAGNLSCSAQTALATLTATNLTVNGTTILNGSFIQNIPLVLNNAVSHTLTVSDAGRNIFINNTTNITTIHLPLLSTITNNGQVIFSFIVQSVGQVFYIYSNSNDGNIVGSIINNDGATYRIDSNKITGSASLKQGDNINLSNFSSGSSKSWYITAGGINTTTSGFQN